VVAELSREQRRKAHHYYVYDGDKVDAQAMRDEAEYRAFDTRTPEDSVIHFHPYTENGCPRDTKHTEYEVGKGVVKDA
jgi:hypothetical protein